MCAIVLLVGSLPTTFSGIFLGFIRVVYRSTKEINFSLKDDDRKLVLQKETVGIRRPEVFLLA